MYHPFGFGEKLAQSSILCLSHLSAPPPPQRLNLYKLYFMFTTFMSPTSMLERYFFYQISASQIFMCVLVTLSRLTLCNFLDCSLGSSSVYAILQARILEWVTFPSPRYLPDPGIELLSLALAWWVVLMIWMFYSKAAHFPSGSFWNKLLSQASASFLLWSYNLYVVAIKLWSTHLLD